MTGTFVSRLLRQALCIAALTLATSPASAQTPPNLVGTWEGKAEAGFVDPNPYRIPDSANPNFGSEMEFTYVIRQQQRTRFSGELTAVIGAPSGISERNNARQ